MSSTVARKPLYRSLYVQVLVAVAIGVLLGHFRPELGTEMKPLGDAFIKLIKMIIAPIIFCTVVVGIAGMEDMKKVGKTGGLALLYFEIVSTVALVIGLVIVNLVQPGSGMHVDPASLDTKGIAAYTAPGKMQGTVDFLLGVIPTSVVDAFAKGDILQVLLFSVLFGFALHKFGGRGTMVFDFIEKTSHVLFDIVGIIMKVAPIGAFGAMAFTIGKYGVGSLFSLGKLMGIDGQSVARLEKTSKVPRWADKLVRLLHAAHAEGNEPIAKAVERLRTVERLVKQKIAISESRGQWPPKLQNEDEELAD